MSYLAPVPSAESVGARSAGVRRGILKLLEIKDSEIRILTLEQSRDAADKGLHAGGAFSATIPLVALFYGGFIDVNVADPTAPGQDMFVLSKGHAIAALASIYADLGYFDKGVLRNSRSWTSILNGHPGPVLPGIQVATGPMGQGLSVAQGFALAGRTSPKFDSYALTGDGELQEGTIWEAVMLAATKQLDNLCVLVDQNNGQLDIASRMVFPMPRLEDVFASFGWRVFSADATQYDGVVAALEDFRNGARNGKPTAIICHGRKGFGACSDFLNKHKVVVTDALIGQELDLQRRLHEARIEDYERYRGKLDPESRAALDAGAKRFTHSGVQLVSRVPARDKTICYSAPALPKIDAKKEYASSDIVTAAMKVFACNPRVISIDADLGTTSGLEAGVAAVDQRRALNVGVAEANMMGIGEAFAALGYNTWVSTFCPFFNWQVLRRLSVGHQERLEAIAARDGWLSEGHGLDLTFLATGPDFETRTNGATHMGNDDITMFDGSAHLRIVNVSCPRQLLAVMQWVMEGNRGLLYVRVMRAASPVLYGEDYRFEFGKSWKLRGGTDDQAVIVSSGRGVHEALAAAEECAKRGIPVGVIDMPSVDEDCLADLARSEKLVLFAEQNNGFLWQNYARVILKRRCGAGRVIAVNALDAAGRPQFIHSALYEELLEAFGLSSGRLADVIVKGLSA